MKMFILLAVASILLCIPAISFAVVNVTGVQGTMIWTEPTGNKDGSPLTDLAKTEGTFQIPGQPETVCGISPALSPTGGQERSVSCVVPVPQDSEFDVTFRAYAYDLSGNKSDATSLIKRIDLLPPGTPVL